MKAAAGKHNCRSRNRDGERERERSGAVCSFIAYFGIGFTAPFSFVRSFAGFFREMAPGLNLSGSERKRGEWERNCILS